MTDRPVQQFDVVIIGAGPAGSAAAITVVRAGMSVAVIDKAVFPRDKLCGGLFTGRARGVFETVFGRAMSGRAIYPGLFRPCGAFEFHIRDENLGTVRDAPPVWLTMRREMDQALLQMALADGAVDFTGCRPAWIDPVAVRVGLGDGREIAGRVLIGADGVNSAVARAAFGAAFDRARIGFAMEVEATGAHVAPDAPIRIDFAAAAGGYGWHFPKCHSTTIGIGGPLRSNPEMKSGLARYLAQAGIAPGEFAMKGHFIPCGDFRRVPGQGRVLLAGDAAGLVDPVTGEGIAHAMQSGYFAALSAADAVRQGDPARALPLYRRRLAPIRTALRLANLIRPVLFSPALEAGFARSFRKSQTLKQMYLQVLAGEVEYRALFRQVLRRAPRLALRAARGTVGRD